MLCKNCGSQLPDNAAFCPKCGTEVLKKKPALIMLAGAALVTIVAIGVGVALISGRRKSEETEALEKVSIQQTEEINEAEKENGEGNPEAEDGQDEEASQAADVIMEQGTESGSELNVEETIHLRHLMESMALAAWGNNDYESWGYSGNTAKGMQAWADGLYQGNWECMGDWLGTVALTYYLYPKGDYEKDREDIRYIEEIMTSPDAAEILQDEYKANDGGWLLTKEQLEYLAYAASGTSWNLQEIDDVMGAHPVSGGESSISQIDNRILFSEGAAGSMEWVNLENITSESTGEENWKVSADCIYSSGYDDSTFEIQIADIAFTVIKNPDSCFDGYSITGMKIICTDNSGWAQAYDDYLTEGKIKDDLGFQEGWEEGNHVYIDFCYIDEDTIPEMCIRAEDGAELCALYTYYNGQVELLSSVSHRRAVIECYHSQSI